MHQPRRELQVENPSELFLSDFLNYRNKFTLLLTHMLKEFYRRSWDQLQALQHLRKQCLSQDNLKGLKQEMYLLLLFLLLMLNLLIQYHLSKPVLKRKTNLIKVFLLNFTRIIKDKMSKVGGCNQQKEGRSKKRKLDHPQLLVLGQEGQMPINSNLGLKSL